MQTKQGKIPVQKVKKSIRQERNQAHTMAANDSAVNYQRGYLPSHRTTQSLSQTALLQMHHQLGNRAVQHFVNQSRQEKSMVQTQQTETPTDNTDVETVGNPLVGLKKGDGLDFGTWERRPRVKLLQQKLNEKMLAGLDVDGMFGFKTEQVLQEFQLSIGVLPQNIVDPITADALMGKKREKPPQDQPPGKLPQEQPPHAQFNPELEDIMDAVWLQYQMMLKHQNDALNRLEQDLSEQEFAGNIGLDIFIAVVQKVLDVLLFSQADGLLRTGITDAIRENEDLEEGEKEDIIKTMVSPVFDLSAEPAKTKAKEIIIEQTQEKRPTLSIFIESERASLTEASDAAQEAFLLETKPALRRRPATPTVGREDRRVFIARKNLQAVKNQKLNAFAKQYDKSLEGWAQAQAHSKLGVKESKARSIGDDVVSGTDLSKAKPKILGEIVPGVLDIDIDGSTPDKPVTIEGAEISGLSKIVREKLQKKNPMIRDLGFPRIASGKVNEGFLGIKLFNASITIGRNETGDDFEIGSTDGGKEWLREKAAIDLGKHKGQEDDFPPGKKPDELTGIRVIFDDEIDNKRLSQVPDGLQGP